MPLVASPLMPKGGKISRKKPLKSSNLWNVKPCIGEERQGNATPEKKCQIPSNLWNVKPFRLARMLPCRVSFPRMKNIAPDTSPVFLAVPRDKRTASQRIMDAAGAIPVSSSTNHDAPKEIQETRRLAKRKAYESTWGIDPSLPIPEEERVAVAERLCRHRIRRIEFPKDGDPVTLSETDKVDAMAAGMLACVQFGFFETGKTEGINAKGKAVYLRKAIRSAMEGKACLRRDCFREYSATPLDLEKTAKQVGFVTQDRFHGALTLEQRDAAREIMKDLRAARSIDGSRKSAQAFRSHRKFFLETLGILTGTTSRARSGKAFSESARRFQDYLATGRRLNAGERLSASILSGIQAQSTNPAQGLDRLAGKVAMGWTLEKGFTLV